MTCATPPTVRYISAQTRATSESDCCGQTQTGGRNAVPATARRSSATSFRRTAARLRMRPMYGAANISYLKGKADPYEEKDKDKWSVTLTAAEVQDQKLTERGLFDRHGREGGGDQAHRRRTIVAEVTVTDTDRQAGRRSTRSERAHGVRPQEHPTTRSSANAAAASSRSTNRCAVKTAPSPT